MLLLLVQVMFGVHIAFNPIGRWLHFFFVKQALFQSLLSSQSSLSDLSIELWWASQQSLWYLSALFWIWYLLQISLVVWKACKVQLGCDGLDINFILIWFLSYSTRILGTGLSLILANVLEIGDGSGSHLGLWRIEFRRLTILRRAWRALRWEHIREVSHYTSRFHISIIRRTSQTRQSCHGYWRLLPCSARSFGISSYCWIILLLDVFFSCFNSKVPGLDESRSWGVILPLIRLN